MQQNNNLTHNQTLNNGLLLDIEYYMQNTEIINITIGYLFCNEKYANNIR